MATNIRLRVLPSLLPRDGRQVELQATATHIQWRYVADFSGEYAWIDLIELSNLVGPEGPSIELRADGENIQYRVVGNADWIDLVLLSDLQGLEGPPGPQGPSVSDGDKVDVVVSGAGSTWKIARNFDTVAELLADTDMDYTTGVQAVFAGQVVTAQGYRYEVAESAASDQHVTTAGGVKLYVLEPRITLEMFGGSAGGDPAANRLVYLAAMALGRPLDLHGTMYPITATASFTGQMVNGGWGGGWIFSYGGVTPTFGQLGDNSLWENVRFVCTADVDISTSRPGNNCVITRCHFEGFIDTTGSDDGHGLYFKDRTNVRVESTSFYNNGVDDVSIVDNNRDIVLVNLFNDLENGVYLNFEPNAYLNGSGDVIANRNVTVIGGRYRDVLLQENDNSGISNQNISFRGAEITRLTYDGAEADFTQCQIDSLAMPPAWSSPYQYYAGPLRIDNAYLGPNLLPDPHMFDLSRQLTGSGGISSWDCYFSSFLPADRYERFLISAGVPEPEFAIRFPKVAASGTVMNRTRDMLTGFTPGEKLLAVFRGFTENVTSADPENMAIEWYNDSDVVVGASWDYIKTCRTTSGTTSELLTVSAVIQVPATATKCRVLVGKLKTNNSRVTVHSVGLHRITVGKLAGNWDAVMAKHVPGLLSDVHFQHHAPVATAGFDYPNSFRGERISVSNPSVGNPKGYVCTANGTPGTWVSEGNL